MTKEVNVRAETQNELCIDLYVLFRISHFFVANVVGCLIDGKENRTTTVTVFVSSSSSQLWPLHVVLLYVNLWFSSFCSCPSLLLSLLFVWKLHLFRLIRLPFIFIFIRLSFYSPSFSNLVQENLQKFYSATAWAFACVCLCVWMCFEGHFLHRIRSHHQFYVITSARLQQINAI